jgi:probable HAF family extracellular repeat protein
MLAATLFLKSESSRRWAPCACQISDSCGPAQNRLDWEDQMKQRHAALIPLLALAVAACEPEANPVDVTSASRAALSTQATDRVYRIAHLPSFGSVNQGNGIDNRGLVVGSSGTPSHAVAWEDGAPEDLGTLGGAGTNSNVAWPGLNTNGSQIVGISETDQPGGESWACRFFFAAPTGNQCLGFVYEDGVMRSLPPFDGGTNSFATGVNARGQVIGWAENGVEDPTCNAPVVHQFRAAMWLPRTGATTELRPLPGDSTSAATAINDSGRVVGISGDCANAVGGFSARHAVLWEPDGSVIDIGNIGGEAWHTPMDINERGEIVGFGNPPEAPGDAFAFHAFYRSADGQTVKDLGVLEGQARSQALGINNRGQVVGQSSGSPNGRRAFLWEGGESLIDLNDQVEPSYKGTLLSAGHINDLGVITGVALDPATGVEVVFTATPIGKGGRD